MALSNSSIIANSMDLLLDPFEFNELDQNDQNPSVPLSSSSPHPMDEHYKQSQMPNASLSISSTTLPLDNSALIVQNLNAHKEVRFMYFLP